MADGDSERPGSSASTNASYVADTIVFLSYGEVGGELDRAVGVVEKRLGDFDSPLHRFSLVSGGGLVIEKPFDDVRGMRGSPAPRPQRHRGTPDQR